MDYSTKLKYFKKFEKILPTLYIKERRGIDIEDRIQMAQMVLWSSIEDIIKIAKAKKLSEFATARRLCQWRMIREVRKVQYLIRMPAWIYDMKKSNERLQQEIKLANNYVSLKEWDNDYEIEPEEFLVPDNSSSPELFDEQLDSERNKKILNRLLIYQPEQTRYIINSYYGLNGYQQKNFRTLAEELGISHQAATERRNTFLSNAYNILCKKGVR